ncbi:MAG: hypothetical protein H7832_06320 [Magnetococcus sp. DMHC-6]
MNQQGLTASSAGLDLVVFTADGLRFGIVSTQVCGLHPHPGESLAILLNFSVVTHQTTCFRSLRVLSLTGERFIRVEEPIYLRHYFFDALHPLPPLIAALPTAPAVRGLAWDEGGAVVILDPGLLPEGRDRPSPFFL